MLVVEGEEYGAIYAARLDAALVKRLRPNGPISATRLCELVRVDRKTLSNWRRGETEFSFSDVVRLDAALTLSGATGLYAEVAGSAPMASGPWDESRLPLEALNDPLRVELLQAYHGGADPLEAAARLGLIEETNIICRMDEKFVSVYVGSALPVDQSVRGKPIADRSDLKYAAMITRHLEEASAGPTLYRLSSSSTIGQGIQYRRLALPGRGGVTLTLPFDRQVASGLRIR